MHSSKAIAATDFTYRYDDKSTGLDAVMPDITIPDRLGVVLRESFDGLGAATFVLVCVTVFYDEYRAETADFYAYSDYFTFQSDWRRVDYRWFDIWLEHKNIQTDRDAEAVLRAINDRGITHILVPRGGPVIPISMQ